MLRAACGVWHTAAIAAGQPDSNSKGDALAGLGFLEGSALQANLAAVYELLDEVASHSVNSNSLILSSSNHNIEVQAERSNSTARAGV